MILKAGVLLLGALLWVAGGGSSVAASLPVRAKMPSLAGASWLNSPALTNEALHGKVVLVDFWTYSCINCLRSLPYVNAWYDKYKDYGLVVIGVHAPEFNFEKDARKVGRAIEKLGIRHPVVLDNDSKLWNAFHNQYWPTHYFVDAKGRIRGSHSGEGDYAESEHKIRQLLTEAGFKRLPTDTAVAPKAVGAQAPANAYALSPETYLGYGRAEQFSSSGGFSRNSPKSYAAPATLKLNQWGLEGRWLVSKEHASLESAPGKIVFRFYARDLHLVLGPGKDDKPVRFRVLLDGAVPAGDHGMDIDANGEGVVRDHRLYQLIRQSKGMRQHTFTIEFLDAGVQAFAFTFG